MSSTATSVGLRWSRGAVVLLVALLLALMGAFGTRTTAEATTDQIARAGATVNGCRYGYICLYENYNYSAPPGTRHDLLTCGEYYYTPYAFHSVVNNQTTGTRASFYAKNASGGVGQLIWTSRAALWQSGNVDGIAGGLGSRTWYVRPC